MSELIEQQMIATGSDLEALRELCAVVFHNEHGQRLIAKLVSAANPMQPRFDPRDPNPTMAAFRDGQRDVTGFLWRYGAQFKQPPQPQP